MSAIIFQPTYNDEVCRLIDIWIKTRSALSDIKIISEKSITNRLLDSLSLLRNLSDFNDRIKRSVNVKRIKVYQHINTTYL